jgi:hypothetical protein
MLPLDTDVREPDALRFVIWIDAESLHADSQPKVPFCACCYRLEDFSVATFAQAFPQEEALSCLEQLQAEGGLIAANKSPASCATRV